MMQHSGDLDDLLLKGSLIEIQRAYLDRRLRVEDAVRFYIARIETIGTTGAAQNAVRTISPTAIGDARACDARLAKGEATGSLFGIPVLLKDNILASGMPASAGARALADFRPLRDATIVRRLRAAGAVILGKTNMTEFADYVSEVMPSEFSGAGGTVRHPFGKRYDRGFGSSVGSAAAVAAGLAPIAIGSETQNSIQSPACASSVYGYKPSVGQVSRAGIVPLVPSQDTAGPIARCVEDAALVCNVLFSPDAEDTATLAMRPFTRVPDIAPSDLRIGVLRRTMTDRQDVTAMMPLFEDALSRLGRAGARIVDPCDLPSAELLRDLRSSVFRTEFKAALDCFLSVQGAPCGMGSLADIIAWNSAHPDAIPHGQGLLEAAQATAGLDDPAYRADRARDVAISLQAGLAAALDCGCDVLVAPMGAAAKCTGKAGAPALSIPLGLDATGAPAGLTLTTLPGRDAFLLGVGAAVARVIDERVLAPDREL